jgi:S-(hydroxymethyl)glutathione dehydrogenase/alcohol dehydrogenase
MTTSAELRPRAALIEKSASAHFELRELELGELQPGEVLVDVRAAGLCHSDWTLASHDYELPQPALLGHELAGVVRSVGEGVTEFAVGDHVVGCGIPSCGACDRCLEGKPIWCRHPERTARAEDDAPRLTNEEGEAVWQVMGIGCFAEQTIVHQRQLVKIDNRVPFDKAAVLGCAVTTGASVVIRAAQVRPGESVVVFGAGGVGLNVVQTAALVGARKIISIDVQDDKLELARKFGATHTVNARNVDAVEAVREITGGYGVEHVFEVTGLPQPLQQGYDMRAIDGALYIVGMQAPGSTFELPSWDVERTGKVQMVFMGSSNFKVDIPFYAELYLQSRLNLDDLVSRKVSLDQINDEYARILAGSSVARSVITFD